MSMKLVLSGRVAVGSSSFTIPYAQLAGSATVTVYVTTGSCVSTDTIFVEENVISDAGTITGTQTICSGDTPLDLTSTSTVQHQERLVISGSVKQLQRIQLQIHGHEQQLHRRVIPLQVQYQSLLALDEYLLVLNGNSCEGAPTGFVVVTIGTPPVINFTNLTTTTICTGDTVQFEATQEE